MERSCKLQNSFGWQMATLLLCGMCTLMGVTSAHLVHSHRHSFETPLPHDDNLSEWSVEGASIIADQRVVLLPAVRDRVGQLWHKVPLNYISFEAEFQFQIEGDNQPAAHGFAFWYVYDDVTSQVQVSEQLPPSHLFGYKNDFRGLGVFFSMFAYDQNEHNSISATYNNGTQTMTHQGDIPTNDGVYYGPLRNTAEPYFFRLHVNATSVEGKIKPRSAKDWVQCFRVAGMQNRPGGHVGFTASSRPQQVGQALPGDVISILSLFVTGDSTPPADSVISALNPRDVQMLLSERHSDEPSNIAKELGLLSRILYQSLLYQDSRQRSIEQAAASLSVSMDRLVKDTHEVYRQIGTMFAAVQGKLQSPSQGDPHLVQAVTTELQGLRHLFDTQSQSQADLQDKLHTLHRSIAEPNENWGNLAARSASLEETIKKQATYSSFVGIFGVFLILLVAILIWRRMKEMEKKHLL